MTNRRPRRLVAVVTLLIAASAGEAWAFWTAGGAGQAAAGSGSLVAATLSTPAAATNSITVTWSQQASLTPSASANSSITYSVQRRVGTGSYAAVSTGGCSGTKTYGVTSCVDAPDADGSYTYRVVATFATWTATSVASGPVALLVDATAPTVQSIARTVTNPTNATSVSWTVTFSEIVTGVDSADFALAASGLTATSITAVTGSGTTYTVTASTGTGPPTGTLGLNLVDDDTITDAVTNKLGGTGTGNGNRTGEVYAIDKTPPTAPTAVTVTSGGSIWPTAKCSEPVGVVSYANAAGITSVGVTATVAVPESGETIVFTATRGATQTTTVAVGTPVTLNLTSLDEGAITLNARAKDAAGNLSAPTAATGTVIKDTVVPSLTADYLETLLGGNPRVEGGSECGATITAVRTSGGNVGATYSMTITSGSAYTLPVQGSLLGLGTLSYAVTAADRAGNPSVTRNVSG